MKKIYLQIFLFTIFIITLCFVSVEIFTLPASRENFNLSNKANIGGAIGGMTAPILGIFSSVLLYLALVKQIDSNKDQRIRNESDTIFTLLNQLDKEFDTFYTSFKTGKVDYVLRGAEGLNEWTRRIRYEYDVSTFDFTFRQFYEANQILLLINTFELVEKKVQLSSIPYESKNLFIKKLESFYRCRLEYPLMKINETVEEYPHIKDEDSNEIQAFYLSKPQTKKPR